jgi:hypothetical protein
VIYPVVKILSHTTGESLVYDGRPVPVYVAAHAPLQPMVLATVTFGSRTILDSVPLVAARDTMGRLPVECYGLSVPAELFGDAGDMVISVTAIAGGLSSTDSVTLKLFPPPQDTVATTDSSSLSSALTAIAGGSDRHTLVTLATGTYVFPADTGLWDNDEKLLTFRALSGATVLITDSEPYVRRGIWSGLRFVSEDPNLPGLNLTNHGAHRLTACRFQNVGGGGTLTSTGLQVDRTTRVYVHRCRFSTFAIAVSRADVVRNCYWDDIRGTVFANVSRVVEGTVGHGDPTAAWAVYSAHAGSSPVIRHNVALLGSTPLLVDTAKSPGIRRCAFVGNSMKSAGSGMAFTASELDYNYIAHNTLRVNESTGNALDFGSSRPMRSNYIVNNYLGRQVSTPLLAVNGNVFDYNASAGVVDGSNSLSGVSPVFANDLGVLGQGSPLRHRSVPQPGMSLAFGLLPYQDQIGALPHHPDATNSSVLKLVTSWPEVGAALP